MRGLGFALALAATVVCAPIIFTPETSNAQPVTAAGDKAGIYRIIELKGGKVKWGSPELGTGASVTYAFATEATVFSEARNCRAIEPVDALLARSGISQRLYESEAAKAFDAWSSVADIDFRQVDDADAADILIGAQAKPVGRAFTNVSYTRHTATAVRPLDKSLICLNPDQPWKVGFDGNLNVYDLRYTLKHEIGHAIGLDHPGTTDQVMSFRYEERYDTLQSGDISGAVALYGERHKMIVEIADVLPISIPQAIKVSGETRAQDQQFRALSPVRD